MCDSQTKTEEQRQALAEFVRQETDGGREIMRFFLDVMRNRYEDAKMGHRFAAASALARHGSGEARDFLRTVSRSKNGRAHSRTPAESRPIDDLADFIRVETDDGKEIVRFLLDVMRNRDKDAGMGHKVSAAKELLKRAFDNLPGHTGANDDQHEGANECRNKSCLLFRYARMQSIIASSYQGRLAKIYGDEEAAAVAVRAALQHRRDTMWDHNHIPDHDFTPIDNPEDDRYGKGSYEYKSLCIIFADNQTVRIANKAVEEYRKQIAAALETKEDSNEDPPAAHPQNPPEKAVSKHPEDPDPPAPVTPEPPRVILSEAEGSPAPTRSPSSAILERSEKPPAPPTPTTSSTDPPNNEPPTPEPPRRSGRRKKRRRLSRIKRRQLAAAHSGPVPDPMPALVASDSGRGPPL